MDAKASEDYRKRLGETGLEDRLRSTFVFVSGRNWPRKSKWIADTKGKGDWGDIRAYDPDDLEQWLEAEHPVALAFAEELGRRGVGVESPESYWKAWAARALEPLVPESVFLGREKTRDALVSKLRAQLQRPQDGRLSIHADSVEEVTAFASASALEEDSLAANTIVVTTEDGWRFVGKDPRLAIAIAGSEKAARAALARAGLLVVIPVATGDADRIDMEGGSSTDRGAFVLPRQDADPFEKALVGLGIDTNEARRLSRATGRSWSVYLRHRSRVPEIERPTWLRDQDVRILLAICLVGGWSAERKSDCSIVESLAGVPYADVELALVRLARSNDPPVLRIGRAWKAKSPVELLALCGPSLSPELIDRFFEILTSILSAADPELELDAEDRWRAGMLGKERPESALLIGSMLDSVIKFAVRGEELSGLYHLRLADRAEAFVQRLLSNEGPARWLSLNAYLPALAEAAPRAFLATVERTASQPNNPIQGLFRESNKDTGPTGRSYHAGLLWSLEVLAWNPERLKRVAEILGMLHAYDNGFRGNSALGSLHDILRPWMPQTAANTEHRKEIMKGLAATHPESAFALYMQMVPYDPSGNFTARPEWRQDDTGTERTITNREVAECYEVAVDQAIALARDNARRTAHVVSLIGFADKKRDALIFEGCRAFTQTNCPDADREIVRDAVRQQLYRMRNRSQQEAVPDPECLAVCDRLFVDLAPRDLVARHRWLFGDGAFDLPEKFDERSHFARGGRVDKARTEALNDVFAAAGISEVGRLAEAAQHARIVGYQSAVVTAVAKAASTWIVEKFAEHQAAAWFRDFCVAFLTGLDEKKRHAIARRIEGLKPNSWSDDTTANFLALFPSRPLVWECAKSLQISDLYWQRVGPDVWLDPDEKFHEQEIDYLLEARRPRTAFGVAHLALKWMQPAQLAAILEALVRGEEPHGGQLQPWNITEAIKIVETSHCLDEDRLFLLEFCLLPDHGQDAKESVLMKGLTSKPELFIELLSLIVKRPTDDDGNPRDDQDQEQVAGRAWRLLQGATRLPGTEDDGTICEAKFSAFVDACRTLAGEKGILRQCDRTLGEIIGHAPMGSDGVWPCEAIRPLLERAELDDLRRGFRTGAFNRRGITSRAVFEGGGIERELAKYYREHCASLATKYPRLAEALAELAAGYDHLAHHHDDDARLRKEGH